ncbi:hypothetical protein TNCV_4016071 [Trichonephila clavipes]|nr:hypothetical protein TNCV_4016071 [Trichonephila clavipes]
MDGDSRRVLIWREPGSPYRPSNFVEKDNASRGDLMEDLGCSNAAQTSAPTAIDDLKSVLVKEWVRMPQS